MKYTKSELQDKTKEELLNIATKSGKPLSGRTSTEKIIATILTHQATSSADSLDTGSENLTQADLEEALARITKMEQVYNQKILEMDIAKGIEPSEETLHRLSKEEAEYESIQLKLRERKRMPTSKRISEVRKELTALVRVRVTEIKPKQEAKDVDNQLLIVSWGNSAVSGNTKVPLGTPWHIPVGCYNNLVQATVREPLQPAKGTTTAVFSKPTKRFDVVVLDPLTADEIKNIKERQILMSTSSYS